MLMADKFLADVSDDGGGGVGEEHGGDWGACAGGADAGAGGWEIAGGISFAAAGVAGAGAESGVGYSQVNKTLH